MWKFWKKKYYFYYEITIKSVYNQPLIESPKIITDINHRGLVYAESKEDAKSRLYNHFLLGSVKDYDASVEVKVFDTLFIDSPEMPSTPIFSR